jgi:transcriptional regulator with XRE-family HTH domain
MNKRSGDETDKEIGRRIRALRLERGMSQTELGELLSVSFQQVQKYEKGINRVAAGRLQRISEALGVTVAFFYGDSRRDDPDADTVDVGLGYLETAGAVRLMRAYSRIDNSNARRALVDLAEKIAQ